jgi:hypothetical protein
MRIVERKLGQVQFTGTLTDDDYRDFGLLVDHGSINIDPSRQGSSIELFAGGQWMSGHDVKSGFRTLDFKGPEARAEFYWGGFDTVEAVTALAVTDTFTLDARSGTRGGVRERTIVGGIGKNEINLRGDEHARNTVRTFDGDDTIHLGSEGGTIHAAKGHNEIYCGRGVSDIVISKAGDSTLQDGSDANLTMIGDFTPEKDHVKLLFPTKGFVSKDIQERIDNALAALSADASLSDKYSAATNVEGVKEGHVFHFGHADVHYLAVENVEATLIGFEISPYSEGPQVPMKTDVIFA